MLESINKKSYWIDDIKREIRYCMIIRNVNIGLISMNQNQNGFLAGSAWSVYLVKLKNLIFWPTCQPTCWPMSTDDSQHVSQCRPTQANWHQLIRFFSSLPLEIWNLAIFFFCTNPPIRAWVWHSGSRKFAGNWDTFLWTLSYWLRTFIQSVTYMAFSFL